MSLLYAPGTIRPPNVLAQVSAASTPASVDPNTGNEIAPAGAVMPLVAGRGVLNSITINAASPGALVWAFDNAEAATGVVLPSNTLGVNLASGVTLNFDVTYFNGLTLLISGTINCTVSYYSY